MAGSSGSTGGGIPLVATPRVGVDGLVSGTADQVPQAGEPVTGSDNVSEMMGRLRLTVAEATAVVLDDGADGVPVHSKWALVGKVLAPNKLHISTISAALRPAWGNPRGLLLNPAGDNLFVAEFATKADKTRVQDGPPWVVGKHAVLLREFDVDLRPRDMIFNGMKIWARILDLPFGYMHKRHGATIAGSLGMEGSVPVVDCDAVGKCWGSYMRVRVEVDVDKPLMRGVTVFSQRRNTSEWFDVQYEHLPHYCYSCGIVGHSSTECKTPGERDDEGRLPYSADRLCAPDERKQKMQGAQSSSDSVSAEQGRSSSQATEQPVSSATKNGAAANQRKGSEAEVSSPIKKRPPRRTNVKVGKGKEMDLNQGDGTVTVGNKRKTPQVYRPKAPAEPTVVADDSLALVIHQDAARRGTVSDHSDEDPSTDSNKKLKKGVDDRSADLAGTAEQARCTQ
ncbi:unnamed protein product [Alopecurus aequalis]